jgi:hypothetical protein
MRMRTVSSADPSSYRLIRWGGKVGYIVKDLDAASETPVLIAPAPARSLLVDSGPLHGSASLGGKEALRTAFSPQVSEVLRDHRSRDACTLGVAVEAMEWCGNRV